MQGRSLLPLLRDPAVEGAPAYLTTWRQEPFSKELDVHQIVAVQGGHKVVLDLSAWSFAFFDLEADPNETTNLIGSRDARQRARFRQLAGALVGWQGL
jgi:hypothetical protein